MNIISRIKQRLQRGKNRQRTGGPSTLKIPVDIDPANTEIIHKVAPYTMTSPERIAALCDAVRYVVRNEVQGDFVECGVWRGGSVMAVAETLVQLEATNRRIHLFDTFDGIETSDHEQVEGFGKPENSKPDSKSGESNQSGPCVSHLQEVQENLLETGYPPGLIKYYVGKVETTVPADHMHSIALLRLDTDWYESTRHGLIYLYPLLRQRGVLIVDDYGHWRGCRKAVDEYFAEQDKSVLLNRIDYTGRIAVKAA